ncbi:diguanylate cyclase [Marinimicrobium sp. C6131]|uniref:sensor domain-containing diguanylate cyclase n=1 Tax=Marinimicrobium sp. C6131 TaxID=3022676 RepID=UPI00223D2AD1|nr:diguanylate cyclase [Marinimicrobium sp. C6131]UZJ43293.1 diguanylate cyclase [Marinimicrobium sp. C6131]
MIRRRWLLSLPLLLCSLLATSATGGDRHGTLSIAPGQDTYSLTGRILVLEVPKGSEPPLSDLLAENTGEWQPLTTPAPNFSFSDSTYWLKLRIANPNDNPRRLILDIAQPLQDYIDAWWAVDGNVTREWHTGDRRPLSDRPFRYRGFALSLPLSPGQSGTLLVRLDSHDGLYDALPLTLSTDAAFFKRHDVESLGFGFYYGAITILLLYNLIVGLVSRERNFVLYSIYLFFFLSWNLAFRGYLGISLLANYPTLNNVAVAVLSCGLFFSLIAFTQGFLNLKVILPRTSRLLWGLSAALLAPTVLAIMDVYATTFAILIPIAIVILLIVLYAGTRASLRGSVSARIFLLAWSLLIAAALAYYARVFGLLPSSWLLENALNIGSLIEVLVLSLALAYRINELKQKDLLSQRQLIDQKEQLNAELQLRVENKTRELQSLADKLEQESITDALTGLLNRRTFYPRLESELRRLQREPTQTLCLTLLDLDYFKALNDHYGHPAGDQLLKAVGDLLQHHWKRSGDAVFRLGGEEFAILFYTRNLHTVTERLEEFKQALKTIPLPGTPLPTEGVPRQLTASLGVGLVSALYSLSPDELYAMADRALYAGKDRGRDCIHYCSATDRTPRPRLEHH